MIPLSDRILRLARALPDGPRQPIDLAYGLSNVEVYSGQEIARIMKISRARVRDRIDRGLRLIWLALDDETVEPETLHDLLTASRMRERAGLIPFPEGG